MEMKEIICAIILFAIAVGAFVISVRSFKEKGFLFNNAYLYASKKERATMNKKQYYIQSAIVFLLMGISFLLNTLSVILSIDWIFYVVIILIIITVIYAIVSSILIESKGKKRG